MAHTTRFTLVSGDMKFTRTLPSRSLADYMGVQAIGITRTYDYWASRDYTKSAHILSHLGILGANIVNAMVKEWEEFYLDDEDESDPQNILLNQFYVEITHFD